MQLVERELLEQRLIAHVETTVANGTLQSKICISSDALDAHNQIAPIRSHALEDALALLELLHRRHVEAQTSPTRTRNSRVQPFERLPAKQFEPVFLEMAGPRGLTSQHPTFRREHVLREVALRSPVPLTVEHTAALAEQFLSQEGILLTGLGARASQRFTTNDMLQCELRVIAHATESQGAGIACVDPEVANDVLNAWESVAKSKRLNDERREALRYLTTSGNGVDVLLGSAGAGKTNLMEAARDIWGAAGIPVIGTALRPVALGRLAEKTGIPTIPLATLIEQHDVHSLNRAVVIIDEAACVGTRMLDQLFTLARAAQAKVVLVGDPHQIAADEAAGAIPALERRLDTIQRLTGTRRQERIWERVALLNLRSGDLDAAIDEYIAHKRVFSAETTDQAHDQVIARFLNRFERNHAISPLTTDQSALIVARDAGAVDLLNRRVRTALRARGHLTGEEIQLPSGITIASGDLVFLLFTASYLNVQSGAIARVVHVNTQTGAVTISVANGTREVTRVIPAVYLANNQLAYAYALTVHDAQALKVAETMYLASPQATRDEAYTALSRGIRRNAIYVEPASTALPGQDVRAVLATRFGRSRAARMAIDVMLDSTHSTQRHFALSERLRNRVAVLQTTLTELDVALNASALSKKESAELAEKRKQAQRSLDQLDQQLKSLEMTVQQALNVAAIQGTTTVHREFAELNAIEPGLAQAFGDLAERYASVASHLANETVLADHVVIDVGDGVIFEADFLIRHPRGVYVKEVKAGKGTLTSAQRAAHPRMAKHGGTIVSGTIHDPASIKVGDTLGPTPVVREIWR